MSPEMSAGPGAALGPAFYARPTLVVAEELLGKRLCRRGDAGTLVARIVEVEAYVGPEDRACHAARGRTRRNATMFGPPGHAYVYLIYGMYHCLNLVTEREGYPAAVLVRAAEPLAGLPAGARLDGPGRLCRALDIDLRLNGRPLFCTGDDDGRDLGNDVGNDAGQDVGNDAGTSVGECVELWVEDPGEPAPVVARGPRVGIGYAGEWAARPWRLWVADSPFVSRPGASRLGRASR